jgi:hypothetical protein
MLEAKAARKRAEADVNLLANRLQHLRNEEAKARKKIDETRKRAGEIKSLKDRNKSSNQHREQLQSFHNQVVAHEQQDVTATRTNRKAQIESAMTTLKQSRHNEVENKRAGRKQNEEMIAAQRAAERKRNEDRKLEIKRAQQAALEKKRKDEQERQQRIQEEYRQRMEEERQRKDGAENTIAQMEREEELLIERLRQTQNTQRQAYEELQSTLHA